MNLLIGTRKGAFILTTGKARKRFAVTGPHFLGSVVNHVVQDPRDRKTLLMAAKTGHLGPTIFRSTDGGRSWKEASRPPAFPKAAEADKDKARAVDSTFWLTPGHASEPGTWYAGTAPHGLFRSADGGASWDEVAPFSAYLAGLRAELLGATPDNAITHSVLVDPRDPAHLYVGLSVGGFFESADRGETWRPLNKGLAADFNPEKGLEYGHDPHCVQLHSQRPDRLYQANHCGIYRLDRAAGAPGADGGGDTWERIGNNMPKEIGDIGFPITLHPRDPETAWVFPMDGTEVWPRTSIGGKPAVYRTRDAGASWERQDAGLPEEQAWFTVKRQAMAADGLDPVGLYFGTTSGEVWASADEGATWRRAAEHLPHIYSVEVAEG